MPGTNVVNGTTRLRGVPFKIALYALATVGGMPIPSVASATTYFVSPSGNDLSPGTQAAPWQTIQKAANTLVGGDTAILLDGTYTESAIIFPNSGTAAAPITFRAQNKWQAIVSSTSSCDPAFSIGGSFITVEDVRFAVSPMNVACATYTSTNTAIRAWQSNVPTPTAPTSGTAGFTARGILVDFSPARALALKSNQDSTLVEDSEFHDQVVLFNNANSTIRNNIVFGEGLANDVAVLAKGGVRNARIYGNVVHVPHANTTGIMIGGYSCDTCHFDAATNVEAYNSVAYNNVVINDSTGDVAGLAFKGANDSAFFNNSTIGCQIAMTLGGHDTGPQAPVSNPKFINNIIHCNGRPATSAYFGWEGFYTGALIVDHDDFFNCASGVPAQTNPVTGDPSFVNSSSDWHLNPGSPAVDSGVATSMPAYGGGSIDVSRDRAGVPRTAPWDLGIYDVYTNQSGALYQCH